MNNIINFDTSVTMRKMTELEWSYLFNSNESHNYVLAISYTVFIELKGLTSGKNDNEIRAIKDVALKRIQEWGLRFILDYTSLVYFECCAGLRVDNDFPKDFPLIPLKPIPEFNYHTIQHMLDTLNVKIESAINSLDIFENDVWDRIPVAGLNILRISTKDIEARAEELAEHLSKNSVPVKDKLQNDLFNRCPYYLIGVGISYFKTKCPAFYSLFRIVAFTEMLQRPKGAMGRFTISLDDDECKIKINKNFITDLLIGASSLAYIKSFVTRDLGQAKIIRKLFPEYSEKIVYIAHVDSKITCE